MSSPVFVETSPITGEFIELQSLVKDVNGNKEFLHWVLRLEREGGF